MRSNISHGTRNDARNRSMLFEVFGHTNCSIHAFTSTGDKYHSFYFPRTHHPLWIPKPEQSPIWRRSMTSFRLPRPTNLPLYSQPWRDLCGLFAQWTGPWSWWRPAAGRNIDNEQVAVVFSVEAAVFVGVGSVANVPCPADQFDWTKRASPQCMLLTVSFFVFISILSFI